MEVDDRASVAGVEARRTLAQSLAKALTAALSHSSHSRTFLNAVPLAQVPDYHDFVALADEMNVGKIQQKLEQNVYDNVDQFRADVDRIVINAATYNGPDGGKAAYEPVIHWARELQSAVEQQLPLFCEFSAKVPAGDGSPATHTQTHPSTSSAVLAAIPASTAAAPPEPSGQADSHAQSNSQIVPPQPHAETTGEASKVELPGSPRAGSGGATVAIPSTSPLAGHGLGCLLEACKLAAVDAGMEVEVEEGAMADGAQGAGCTTLATGGDAPLTGRSRRRGAGTTLVTGSGSGSPCSSSRAGPAGLGVDGEGPDQDGDEPPLPSPHSGGRRGRTARQSQPKQAATGGGSGAGAAAATGGIGGIRPQSQSQLALQQQLDMQLQDGELADATAFVSAVSCLRPSRADLKQLDILSHGPAPQAGGAPVWGSDGQDMTGLDGGGAGRSNPRRQQQPGSAGDEKLEAGVGGGAFRRSNSGGGLDQLGGDDSETEEEDDDSAGAPRRGGKRDSPSYNAVDDVDQAMGTRGTTASRGLQTQHKPGQSVAQRTGGGFPASRCRAHRRHKSKVFVKANKVVYLPTTFIEELWDTNNLPPTCILEVEADGVLQPEEHHVSVKQVPRAGLSTMYCVTNVVQFQLQYLNWQILDWTKEAEDRLRIHLQTPLGKDVRPATIPAQPGSNMARDGSLGMLSVRTQMPKQLQHPPTPPRQHHQQQYQQDLQRGGGGGNGHKMMYGDDSAHGNGGTGSARNKRKVSELGNANAYDPSLGGNGAYGNGNMLGGGNMCFVQPVATRRPSAYDDNWNMQNVDMAEGLGPLGLHMGRGGGSARSSETNGGRSDAHMQQLQMQQQMRCQQQLLQLPPLGPIGGGNGNGYMQQQQHSQRAMMMSHQRGGGMHARSLDGSMMGGGGHMGGGGMMVRSMNDMSSPTHGYQGMSSLDGRPMYHQRPHIELATSQESHSSDGGSPTARARPTSRLSLDGGSHPSRSSKASQQGQYLQPPPLPPLQFASSHMQQGMGPGPEDAWLLRPHQRQRTSDMGGGSHHHGLMGGGGSHGLGLPALPFSDMHAMNGGGNSFGIGQGDMGMGGGGRHEYGRMGGSNQTSWDGGPGSNLGFSNSGGILSGRRSSATTGTATDLGLEYGDASGFKQSLQHFPQVPGRGAMPFANGGSVNGFEQGLSSYSQQGGGLMPQSGMLSQQAQQVGSNGYGRVSGFGCSGGMQGQGTQDLSTMSQQQQMLLLQQAVTHINGGGPGGGDGGMGRGNAAANTGNSGNPTAVLAAALLNLVGLHGRDGPGGGTGGSSMLAGGAQYRGNTRPHVEVYESPSAVSSGKRSLDGSSGPTTGVPSGAEPKAATATGGNGGELAVFDASQQQQQSDLNGNEQYRPRGSSNGLPALPAAPAAAPSAPLGEGGKATSTPLPPPSPPSANNGQQAMDMTAGGTGGVSTGAAAPAGGAVLTLVL